MNAENDPLPKPLPPRGSLSPHRCASLGRYVARALVAVIAIHTLPPVLAQTDASGFSFTGTQRSRYESVDPQFRPGLGTDDRVLAVRTSLRFDTRLPKLDVAGEIMDSRALLNDRSSFLSTTVVNALEPVQAYVALHLPAGTDGATSTLRLGLVTLDLGKRRLLARNRYRNTVTSFLGADWERRDSTGRAARAFYLEPRRALPTDAESLLDNTPQVDSTRHDAAFWGVYYRTAPDAAGDAVEGYLLSLRESPADLAAALDIMSAGVRVERAAAAHPWRYEVEAVLQRGTSGGVVAGVARNDLAVHAHFLHAELAYTFSGPWAPTLLAQYDVATGDDDPLDRRNERFNTLFGARRFDFGPTGIFGPFARSNLETPGLRLMLHPRAHLQGMIAYRAYHLESARDAWVGTGLADPSGRSGDWLGREIETRLTWAANDNRLSVETGVAKLELGAFPAAAEGVAPRGDPTYFYGSLTTRF